MLQRSTGEANYRIYEEQSFWALPLATRLSYDFVVRLSQDDRTGIGWPPQTRRKGMDRDPVNHL